MSGRAGAHRVVDFLWDRVHISAGALVLILISFFFTAAVYKIDHAENARNTRITNSVCHVIAGFNHGDRSQAARLEAGAQRALAQAGAEDHIASVWVYARRHARTPESKRLSAKLIRSTRSLADQDRKAAAELQSESRQVRPITLAGC